jgi:hypothetical protein
VNFIKKISHFKEETSPVIYQLADDTIAIIRELVQFSLLTGTNIVDHLRTIQVEYHDELGKLVPTVEYIEAFNEMISDLTRKVEEGRREAEERMKAVVENEESN